MTHRRRALGIEGEARAARYLEARGYQIIARNVRAARVEIDLIARDGRHVVFVEVKTRRASGREGFGSHGRAAESVDGRKQARLRRGALAWLGEQKAGSLRRARLRFDVITCIAGAAPPELPPAPSPTPSPTPTDREAGAQNTTTALPDEARWSIEHWESAF